MGKKLAGLAIILLIYGVGVSHAVTGIVGKDDALKVGRDNPDYSSPTVRVDYDGNILPGMNGGATGGQDIGESTHAWATVYAHRLNVSSNGFMSVHDIWTDLAAASSSSLRGLGFVISTTTLLNTGTTFADNLGDIVQSSVPRNVVIVSSFASETSTTVLSGGATFYGYDSQGNYVQELINWSTTTAYGSVAWSRISSITVQLTSAALLVNNANAFIVIGTSNTFGLTNLIANTSDVYKIVENGADNRNDANVTISTTWSTIRFENTPNDARDFHVWYRVRRSYR